MALSEIEKLELLCQARICFQELLDYLASRKPIPDTDTMITLASDGLAHVTDLLCEFRNGMPTYPSPLHNQEDKHV